MCVGRTVTVVRHKQLILGLFPSTAPIADFSKQIGQFLRSLSLSEAESAEAGNEDQCRQKLRCVPTAAQHVKIYRA